MPRTFLVLSLGIDSNSIFSGFAKKRQHWPWFIQSYLIVVLFIYWWWCYYSILLYVVSPQLWRWSWIIIGGVCNFIAACPSALHHSFITSWDASPHLVGCASRRHMHCIHMHSWEVCYWRDFIHVTMKLSIVGYVPNWKTVTLIWYHVNWEYHIKLMLIQLVV